MVSDLNLSDKFEIDSAGTSAYHSGHLPDSRMREHAIERGYDLNSKARQFNPNVDFNKFDYILTMDNSNYSNVTALASNDNDLKKVYKTTSFCEIHEVDEVPDPYYGGYDGFELVLDILEDACSGLLKKINL